MLKKVIGILGKVSEIMAMITLAAMTSLVLFQIFNRLFFHITVIWTEEFCRYIFVWMCLFSSAYCMYKRGHISVSILQEVFHDKQFVKVLNIIVHVIIIIFCSVVTFYGIRWCIKCSNQYMLSIPSLKIVYVYSALPICFGLMVIFEIWHLIEDLNKYWFKKPAEKQVQKAEVKA